MEKSGGLSAREVMDIKRFPAVEAGFGCLLGMELLDLVVRQPFDETPALVKPNKDAMLKVAGKSLILDGFGRRESDR